MRMLTSVGLVAVLGSVGHAQCQLLLKESFAFGERPHGGNQQPRPAGIEDPLDDYWPQVGPAGAMWISGQGENEYWQFALSAENPLELDPPDASGGVAWGWPGAAAVIPFVAPSAAFRTSLETVTFGGMLYMGYTTSAALTANFQTDGALWMSLNDDGHWVIYANGSQEIVSGNASPAGAFNGALLHIEFTYDPVTSIVSGRAMNAEIPPTHVTLTRPLSYFGMESIGTPGVMVDNLVISTGELFHASAPDLVASCDGGTVIFSGQHNAGGTTVVGWVRDGESMLVDGVQYDGSIVSGSTTTTMTIANINPGAEGFYAMQVAGACGTAQSNRAYLRVCGADLDCSGGVDGDDVILFFSHWDAGEIEADFNRDEGVDGDDVIAFFASWDAGC